TPASTSSRCDASTAAFRLESRAGVKNVDVRPVPIDSHGGPLAARLSSSSQAGPLGSEVAVNHVLGDVLQAAARVHGRLLQETERLGLAEIVVVHQLALGSVDELAGLELLGQREVLVLERLHLLEPAEGDLDRRD